VVCTELGADLLQCEPVYPGVEHSEDERCYSPDPRISPSSSGPPDEHRTRLCSMARALSSNLWNDGNV
jgi:hypothetical protein